MSEFPGKNPYRPGAATAPLHLAGREPQISRFGKILDGAPELPANLRLTGLRGVGKSVLLKELEETAQRKNWAVVRLQLEPRHNTESELRDLIVALAKATERKMSRTRSLRGKVSDAWTASRGFLNVTVEDITPLKTAEIRGLSAKSDGNINVLMGRLTEQGVLYRIQKGQYEYTAPKFAEYLRRRVGASSK